jgi:hypothetical protein
VPIDEEQNHCLAKEKKKEKSGHGSQEGARLTVGHHKNSTQLINNKPHVRIEQT